jgi:hypothetical protein
MLSANVCEGDRCYDKMVQACKETWYKETPDNIKMFSLFADSYEPRSAIEEMKLGEVKLIKDDIILNIPEDRYQAFNKTMAAFDFLLNNYEFDYIVRPTCGTYTNLTLLNEYLKNKPLKNYYDGPHPRGIINALNKNIDYVSGSCMIFSRDVVELLVNDKENIEHITVDDVTFGVHLYKKGILPHDENLKHPDRLFVCDENALKTNFNKNTYQHYFCHSINPNLIYKCHVLTKNLV